jgi:integrase
MVVYGFEPQNEPQNETRYRMTKPKRSRGEGTVYFDEARQRWVGAVEVSGRRRKVTAKTQTDARAKLAKLLAAKTTGTAVANRSVTVKEVVETFVELAVPNRTRNGKELSPSTLDRYRWISAAIIDQIGTMKAADVHATDVEAMFHRLARRKTRPFSRSTLSEARGTLQRAFDFAIRRGDLIANPAAHAELPSTAKRKQERRSLTVADAKRLLGHLRDGYTDQYGKHQYEANGAMFALQLRLGLRPGEASGLHLVDFDGIAVNVTRGVQMDQGKASIADDLKTTASKRTIELPADLIDWLSSHAKAQKEARLAAGMWANNDLMFTTAKGTILQPRNVRRQLAGICERAGVLVILPNELRHSCASLLADEGVPNELIADLLGHTTTRMVDQTYRHRVRPFTSVAANATWAADA